MQNINSNLFLISTLEHPNQFLFNFDSDWNTWMLPNSVDKNDSCLDLRNLWGAKFRIRNYRDMTWNCLGYFSEKKPCPEHNNEVQSYQYRIFFLTVPENSMENYLKLPVNTQTKRSTFYEMFKDEGVKKVNRELFKNVERKFLELAPDKKNLVATFLKKNG